MRTNYGLKKKKKRERRPLPSSHNHGGLSVKGGKNTVAINQKKDRGEDTTGEKNGGENKSDKTQQNLVHGKSESLLPH